MQGKCDKPPDWKMTESTEQIPQNIEKDGIKQFLKRKKISIKN